MSTTRSSSVEEHIDRIEGEVRQTTSELSEIKETLSALVHTDPEKTECMISWARPNSPKALRGFLGLTGYYQTFIKGYGILAAPFTRLLKKHSFEWDQKAEEAFQALKEAVTSPPTLALPNFELEFIVEADASGTGIGAVRM
ncbi:PREDICTED: uncharacterized protein LOC109114966 [Nelumbo nucifera]|uniref:Uncharacterized protein LOC109114966 n=1 Tax=Nelumbo nucifera TaxID=4432 RepID=A0A1U8Q5D3_NELNU|nr:PREDICTED: uncharacterized protein LOC109114966 [Nelumbo nucifera]